MSSGPWYTHLDGQEYGPVSTQQLLRMVRDGIVRRDTLVRHASAREWTRAANVAGLFPDSAMALPGRPIACPMAGPVPDGRNPLFGQAAQKWLWTGVVLACVVLVVVWLAVARQMVQKQSQRQSESPVAEAAAHVSPTPAKHTSTAEVDRTEVRAFVGHTDIVKAVAFSPDGHLLLSGGGAIHIQRNKETDEAHEPKHEASTTKPDEPVNSTEVEELSGDYRLRVWEVDSGRQLKALKGHFAMISAVAFSPNGQYALSADNAGTAILWDTHAWSEVHRFRGLAREQYGLGETCAINAVAFSPDSRRIVLAGWGYDAGRASANYDKNPHLILWDVATGEELTRTDKNGSRCSYFVCPEFIDALHSAAFTPNGEYIVVGASGSNAGMYYGCRNGSVYQAVGSFSLRPRILCRDTRNPDRFTYELEDRNFGSSGHDAPSASFVATAVSPDGRFVVSADTLGRLCLWSFNPTPAKPEKGVNRISQIDLLDRPVRCVAYSPTGRYIATGGDDLFLWHGARDELEVAWELGPRAEGTFRAKPFHIHSLAFSPSGTYLAAGCDDHRIRLWRIP